MGKERKEPTPGDGYCALRVVQRARPHMCKATNLDYCSQWSCMKLAGVPSVVRPPKRVKTEHEERREPPVDLDEARARRQEDVANVDDSRRDVAQWMVLVFGAGPCR